MTYHAPSNFQSLTRKRRNLCVHQHPSRHIYLDQYDEHACAGHSAERVEIPPAPVEVHEEMSPPPPPEQSGVPSQKTPELGETLKRKGLCVEGWLEDFLSFYGFPILFKALIFQFSTGYLA